MTVLFADLVGFTSLTERLDAEDVAIVQSAYFRSVQEVIERRGGHVEKFIGDAVVGSFGVHHARDEDTANAVDAALGIVDEVARIEIALGLPPGSLQVRVGVNTGELVVSRSPGDRAAWRVTGDAVNVAARLQTAAAPGTVLLGPDTALAVAHAFLTEAAGRLDLKGKSLPVPAWRVVGRRDVPSRESALQGLHAATVGRDRELALLERSFDKAADHVEAWLVVAPPGVGKTRLVDELRRRILSTGAKVWTARASQGAAVRYGLVAELLRQALDPAGAAGSLRQLLVDRLDRIGHRDARGGLSVDHTVALLAGDPLDAAPLDLWTSWTAVLDAVEGEAPPVWVVEDLHVAGPDELGFLRHALARPHRPGRMVVMTARPALLGSLGEDGLGGVPIVYLEPLDQADAVRLLQLLVGHGVLPPDIAASTAGASGGNPLFVEEVVRSWVQSGALRPSAAEGWELVDAVDGVDIPNTIRAIYLGQLDDLPDVPRRVLEAGSVPGITFPSRALPVLGVDLPDPALDLLIDFGLLVGPHSHIADPASYTYRHALLRDAAYGVLSRSLRAQLHVRFADWVADTLRLETQAEIVGEHLAAAFEAAPALGVADDGPTKEELRRRAAGWLERAGELAMRAAPQRAVQLLERALTLTEDDEPPAGLRHLRLAEALRRSGRLDEAMRTFARAGGMAEQRDDQAGSVAAALGYEDALFESRLPRDEWGAAGLKLLEAALARPGLADAARGRLLAAVGRAEVYAGRAEEGDATSRHAVDVARRSGDGGALAYALLSRRASLSAPGDLEARLHLTAELVEVAAGSGDLESELEGVRLQFVDLLQAGDVESAAAARHRAETLIAALRRPLFFWYPTMWSAMTALFRGDLAASRRLVEEFRNEGQRWHYRDVDLVHAVQSMHLHIELGAPEAALPGLLDAGEDPAIRTRMAPATAACLARSGRLDDAAAYLSVHAGSGFATLPQDLSLGYTLAMSVEATALIGDRSSSSRLRTLLRPWAGHNIVLGSGAIALGAASHYIGLAARTEGDVAAAVEGLRAAVAMNDEMGATAAATRSRLELARALLDHGAEDESRQVARAGLAKAQQIGMVEVVRETDRLLGGGDEP